MATEGFNRLMYHSICLSSSVTFGDTFPPAYLATCRRIVSSTRGGLLFLNAADTCPVLDPVMDCSRFGTMYR